MLGALEAVGFGTRRHERRDCRGRVCARRRKLDVECVYRAERPCRRAPMEITKGQPGDETRRKKFVDVVRIVILDCR